jgi:chromosome partitioning protein
MRTIAIVNQKGGCGKTITSINLAAFLALQNKVLLVDMDPQGHSTLGVSANSILPTKTLADLFVPEQERRFGLDDIVCRISENLDLAPTDILLSGAPEKLARVQGREDILSQALAEVGDKYDYVVVDCPPSVGLLTFNAVKACSEAIVPMDPSFFSLHGIGKVLETFDLLERETGHHVTARVLVTLYPGRSPFVKAVLEDVHTHLHGRYFRTLIRYSIKLAEAASHGLPITQYCRQCVGFDDYQALCAEVLHQGDEAAVSEAAVSEVQTVSAELSPVEAEVSSELPSGIPSEVLSSEEGPLMEPEPVANDGNWKWADTPGVLVTPEGVVFTVEALGAQRVQLVGDFNGWSVEGSDMEKEGRFWRKVLNLQPGRYLYRFVVDGNWQRDPLNAAVEPCQGGYNSVLVLNEDNVAEAPLN